MTAPLPRSQPGKTGLRHTDTPWMWAWRDDEAAPASIFSMPRVGHAYAVAMCPRYQKPEQWVADAKFIIEAVNSHAALKSRVEAVQRVLKDWQEKLAVLESMRERGDLTKDWGECSLSNARTVVENLTTALSLEGRGGAT